MATALSQQLRQLAVAGAQSSRRNLHGKASLLWTPQKAADIDNDAVYQVARKGFNELCVMDARFKSYEATLFAPGSRELERGQEDADVSAALDAAIEGFCVLLAGYFLLPPAFPALEWLLRRYAAHERCVPALMAAALPCHASNQFVRLVQVCSLRGTVFEFLEPMQESGAALPRSGLIKRCVTDARLLEFVLRLGQRTGAGVLAGRGAMPWYAATMCEVLAAVKIVDEALVSVLLPYIVAGLGGSARDDGGDEDGEAQAATAATPTADYRAATMMVVAQLASRTTLGPDLIQALIRDVCRGTEASGLAPAMLVLMALASRQPQFSDFPPEALSDLLTVPGAVVELARLAEQHPVPGRALGRLLAPAAATLAGSDPQAAAFLDAALSSPGLADAALATTLATTLLDRIGSASADAALLAPARRALRTLDLRFPEVVDEALAARAGTPGFAELLGAVFTGTRHAALSKDTSFSLEMALDAAEPAVRAAALAEIDAMVGGERGGDLGGGNNDDDKAVAALQLEEQAALRRTLRAAALRRVADEAPEVAAAALHIGLLTCERPLAADARRAALHCLETTAGRLLGSGASETYTKKERPHARVAIKRAVAILLPSLAVAGVQGSDATPSTISTDGPEIAAAVLGILHATPHTLAVAQSAAKRCREAVAGSALAALGAALPESAEVDDTAAATSPAKATKSAAAERWNWHVDDELSELLLKSGEAGGDEQALALVEAAYRWSHAWAVSEQKPKFEPTPARRTFAAHSRRAVLHAVSAYFAKKLEVAERDRSMSPCPLATAVLQACVDTGTVMDDEEELVRSAMDIADLDVGTSLDSSMNTTHRRTLVALSGRPALALAYLRQLAVAGVDAVALTLGVATETTAAAEVRVAALALWARAATAGDSDATAVAAATPSPHRHGARPKPAGAPRLEAQATRAVTSGLVAVLTCLADTDRSVRSVTLADVVKAVLLEGSAATGWWAVGADASAEAAAPLVEQALKGWVAAAGRIAGDAEAAPGLLGKLCADDSKGVVAVPATPQPKKTPRKAAAAKKTGSNDSRHALLRLLTHELETAAGQGRVPTAIAVLSALRAAAATPAADEINTVLELERASAAALTALFSEDGRAATASAPLTAAVADLGCSLLQTAGVADFETMTQTALQPFVPGAVRAAAVARLTPTAWTGVLDEPGRRRTLCTLLALLRREESEEVRAAATQVLHDLPLDAELTASLLDVEAGVAEDLATVEPTEKKRRSGKSARHAVSTGTEQQAFGSTLTSVIVPLLEQLQTHPVSSMVTSGALVGAVEQLLHWLAPGVSAPVDAMETDGGDAAAATSEETQNRGPAAVQTSLVDYIGELGLGVLSQLAEAGAAPAPRLETAATILAANLGPGSAAAAATLAAHLAPRDPEAAVTCALELVSSAGSACAPEGAALAGSAQQARVATAAAAMLSAAAQGWACSDVDALTARVIATCQGLRPATALQLLDAILAVTGAPRLLAGLLAVGSDEAQPGARALAAALLVMVPEAEVGQALAALLELSLEQSNGDASAPLACVAVGFAAQQVRRGRGVDADSAAAILAQALAYLQALGDQASVEAQTALDSLLEALQTVVEGAAYVTALSAVLESTTMAPRSRRRAATLLAAVSRRGQGTTTSLDATVVDRACSALRAVVSTADREPASLVEGCLAAATALAGAAAISAASSTAAGPAKAVPKLGALDAALAAPFVSLVVPIAAAATNDSRAGVRAGALAALAALAAALGPRALPQLPAILRAVLGGLERGLADDAAERQEAGEPTKRSSKAASRGRKTTVPEPAAPAPATASAPLELTAAMAALDAVVEGLGPFLATHVHELLRGLLHPRLVAGSGLKTQEAAAPEAARQLASQVLDRLSQTIPVRLFLPAALGLLDDAAARGPRSALGLIRALSAVVPRLGAADVVTHADALAGFCLAALDLRAMFGTTGDSTTAATTTEVETAAVALLCALALRLSESRFRPLFLRLHDWAGAEPSRRLALFAAVCGLADNLRALLVPYFTPIMDDILAAFSAVSPLGHGGNAAPASAPGKKRRKSSPAEHSEATVDDWRLALRAARALHRAFLYDTVEPRFLDEARIDQVLEPLVGLLHAHPPPAAVPCLAAEPWPMDAVAGPAPELGAAEGSEPEMQLSALEVEAAGALAQLAVSRGSEAAWKPLHAALLGATRAGEPQGRLAALRALGALAAGLGDEYLALLPEALPPLAELLEDSVPAVERAAAALFRQLEAMSGEDLGQYLRA